MKKIMLTLIAMLTMTMTAKAMSYEQARNEALFLTDKMAYELNLTDAQYEAAYEINLDYLMSVTSRYDVFGSYWERRNLDLQYILYSWQWDVFRAATYFYRPLYWDGGFWHFGIYARYPHRDYFYFGRPHFYASYRGAHSWRMNGGRSYYEHHRTHFRPDHHRDSHFGMRDGWNRGDYHGNHSTGSSTRITGRNHDNNSGRHSGSHLGSDSYQGSGNRLGNGTGYRGNSGTDNTNNGTGYHGNSSAGNHNNGSGLHGNGTGYRGGNSTSPNTSRRTEPAIGRTTTPRISPSVSSNAAAMRSNSTTTMRSSSSSVMSGSRSGAVRSGATTHSSTRSANSGGGSSRRR